MSDHKIVYTLTDEAPALATKSFLPVIRAFASKAFIAVEERDISLAGRIIANFPDQLTDEQKQSDDLAYLGELAKTADANIIKLPNISASIPQLQAAIKELQGKGYKVPEYPAVPESDAEKTIQKRYAAILGSAVNPVLREGNSDRRVAKPVKEYAKSNPHSMGEWSSGSQTHVASMQEGDFYESEKSVRMEKPGTVKIEFHPKSGSVSTLRDSFSVLEGEIVDCSRMKMSFLKAYFEKEIEQAKKENLLLSLHMKATMMKVSDPIIFGACVETYFGSLFTKHHQAFVSMGINPNNGIGQVYSKLSEMDEALRAEVEADLKGAYEQGPDLAMVDSDKGITNLHVPSDVIIDASMPAAIRSSGKMWDKEGKLRDTKALIPDRSYASVYQKTIEFCKQHGAFDPKTMGSVSNVGLMAKKAEEYGSHDKTFQMPEAGFVKVIDGEGNELMRQQVEKGDIFRACQTKDVAVQDWVKLAVSRARATNTPVVFWLDEARAHDRVLIERVGTYLKDHDTDDLEIHVKSASDAVAFSLERIKEGKDTISATGNVLRDYLTDLFPILELGTSAKMLSIVPLLAGGGLFETGAGGSAPKHVQQFVEEGHLRWDSLGEFLALGVSLEDFAEKAGNKKAGILAQALSDATTKLLTQGKSPLRKVGQLDNRGSQFYLAYYWAEALANHPEDQSLQATFKSLYEDLKQKEDLIMKEFTNSEGKAKDIGGYFKPDESKVNECMRPSKEFNRLIEGFVG